jgi:amino acid transporter
VTVFAWITATAASPAYLASVVQGLVIFNYDSYAPQRWHTTLIMWGFIVLPVVWNLWFRRLLNTLEMIGGICHVVFFIVSVITLAILARRSTPDFVFNTLTNDLSGWTNPTVAWSIGLLTVAFPITGFDGVLHMSDEVKGPRTRVPHSMITAVTLNSIMQFAFMVCLMFTIGDIDLVATSPTGIPIIEVFYQATQSKHATNFLVVMMAVVLFISLFNIFASVSRLTWAFSRDNGLPFSNWFAHVRIIKSLPTEPSETKTI